MQSNRKKEVNYERGEKIPEGDSPRRSKRKVSQQRERRESKPRKEFKNSEGREENRIGNQRN